MEWQYTIQMEGQNLIKTKEHRVVDDQISFNDLIRLGFHPPQVVGEVYYFIRRLSVLCPAGRPAYVYILVDLTAINFAQGNFLVSTRRTERSSTSECSQLRPSAMDIFTSSSAYRRNIISFHMWCIIRTICMHTLARLHVFRRLACGSFMRKVTILKESI